MTRPPSHPHPHPPSPFRREVASSPASTPRGRVVGQQPVEGTRRPVVVVRRADALDARRLHDLLRLRVEAFVVEQACPYAEVDGRDLEVTTLHVWVDDDAGLAGTARVLDDGLARRIGRVCVRTDARGRGLAALLVDAAVAASTGPWVLDAQAHLAGWYAARGFAVDGEEFLEDGIAHVPMRRER